MVQLHRPPSGDGLTINEHSREEVILGLQEAYGNDAFDHEELKRRLHVALSTHDPMTLSRLVETSVSPTVAPRNSSGLRSLGAMLAAAAFVTVVVLGTVVIETSGSGEDDSICITTGFPSNIGCVAQPPQQEEINRLAAAAESVAWQVEDLVSDAPAGSPVERAGVRAKEANRQAQQAARDAQTIMVEALGNDPGPQAFDRALDSARTALVAAGQALADAE